MFKKLKLDDEVTRSSLVGIEYEVLPKAPLLTYQHRTLRYSLSSITPSSRSWSLKFLNTYWRGCSKSQLWSRCNS